MSVRKQIVGSQEAGPNYREDDFVMGGKRGSTWGKQSAIRKMDWILTKK